MKGNVYPFLLRNDNMNITIEVVNLLRYIDLWVEAHSYQKN